MKIRSRSLLAGMVTLGILGGVNARAAIYTFSGTANANWGVDNYSGDPGTPNAPGDEVTFGTNLGSNVIRVITLDADKTVGSFTFNYTVGNGGSYYNISHATNKLIFDTVDADPAVPAKLNKVAGQNNTGNADLISAPIQLNDDLEVKNDVSASNARINLSGVISGMKKITNVGVGRLELRGQSTFTGGVVVNTGAGSVVLGGGGSSAGTAAISSNFGSGTGPLGLGTLTLNNNTSLIYTLNTAAAFNTSTIENLITVNGTSNLRTTGFSTQKGVISGANLSKSDIGTLALAANNDYTGTTAVNGGTLQIGGVAHSTTPTAGLLGSFGIGDVLNSGIVSFARSNNHTVSNNISGTGSVQQVVTGAETTTLSGNNGYTGATTVSSGTIQLGHVNALGNGGINTNTSTGATTATTGTVDLNGQSGVNEIFSLNGTGVGSNGAIVNNSATAASLASGVSALTLTAPGTGLVAGTTVNLTGGGGTGATANALLGLTTASIDSLTGGTGYIASTDITFTGGGATVPAIASITVSGGAITGFTITNPGAGYTSAPTGFTGGGGGSGATFAANDTSYILTGLQITSNGSGYTSAPTVSLSTGSGATASSVLSSVVLAGNSSIGGSGDTTINSAVSGGFGLTKVGAGTVTLAGANSYTGNTTVSGGTLNITGNHTTGANYSVASGANLTTNNIRVTNALTVDGTATINTNGGVNGASKVETLTINPGGKLELKNNDLIVGSAANFDAVRTAIIAGKTSNAATGITSDSAGFGISRGFGYAMGNDPKVSSLLAGSLSGQTYDADSVLVKYTLLGDADLDGDTDLNDLGLWSNGYTGDLGVTTSPTTFWTGGDFDYDGDTDLNDLGLWSSTYTGDFNGGPGSLVVNAPNASPEAVAILNSMGITVVPEPSTFALAGLGLAGLALIRKRRMK